MAASGSGFALAAGSAVGSAVCEMSRKRLVGAGCDAATVVATVCLIEGLVGMLAFVVGTGAMPVPGGAFWLPALAAAAASALTTSMLAKAYSENDISSCAPFNAALPVFQLLVTSFVLRDEARLPAHRIAGVCVITGCAFWLAKVSKRHAGSGGGAGGAPLRSPLLPPGAATVLVVCAIQSVSTKFDQEATKACGSALVYLCYAKLLAGLWAALGAAALSAPQKTPPPAGGGAGDEDAAGKAKASARDGGAARRTAALLRLRPALLLLLLGVAAMEAFYMGCFYASLTRLSKVYVVAIKKGGNLLVTSVGGWVLFSEPHAGRVAPVVGVVAGVALMSI